MTQKNNRRSGRAPETPQRVTNAAEQMYNTSSHGNFRGYVPQQTGRQPAYYAMPQNGGGQQGFGMPAMQEPPKKKRKTWLGILIALLVIGVIGGGAYAGIQISKDMAEKQKISDKVVPYNNLYCPGVYVDGIDLSGMTPEQAMNSVQSLINQRHDAWSVQLTYEGERVATVNSELLNMNVDQNELNALMNEAWAQGHTGTEAERYAQMEALEKKPFQGYTAKPSSDTSQIDTLLTSLKLQIDKPAVDAQVLTFDTTRAYPFLFSEEQTGLNLDIEPLKQQLYQMVSTMQSGSLELVPEVIQPEKTVAELEKHYALRAMATTPIDKHSTEDRNNNIRRCFQLISGTVIQPGKTRRWVPGRWKTGSTQPLSTSTTSTWKASAAAPARPARRFTRRRYAPGWRSFPAGPIPTAYPIPNTGWTRRFTWAGNRSTCSLKTTRRNRSTSRRTC